MSRPRDAGPPGSDRPRALIVGPGRVGLTLAAGLQAAGTHGGVRVAGPAADPPPFLAGRPELPYAPADRWEPAPGGGALEIFFAVPDRVLPEAAREWAARTSAAGAAVRHAFHTSGARPPSVLGPLAEDGASVGVLHPLRAVEAPDPGGLGGTWFGVAGEEDAIRRAGELATALGGRPLRIRRGASARYHAAAVLASSLLLGCLALAGEEMEAATHAGPDEVGEALRALAASALGASGRREGGEGVTGPLARGELETVARHVEALDASVRGPYAGLTRALARRVLELDPATLGELEEILAGAAAAEGPGSEGAGGREG